MALDWILSLLLSADKQHGSSVGDKVTDKGVRLFDTTQGLMQVDQVDTTAITVDESLHLGIPTAGLMAEMNSGIQELLHSDYWCHGLLLLLG
ncbi:unannotated protein [freshwater metagenome]|uniref:Unannotated protein n=1 Tax=freshwater metagenome TaxID=449393 RepID=A0A6J6PMU7_9ZZZZ